VLCLLPSVYLFLLGPAVIQLSDFYTGEGRQALQTGNTGVGATTGRTTNNP
jgi:tight adherence protein C